MNHRAKPHASTGALPPAPGRAKGAEGSTGACPSQGGRLRPRRGQESWARSRSAAAAPAPPPLLLVSHAPRRRHAPPPRAASHSPGPAAASSHFHQRPPPPASGSRRAEQRQPRRPEARRCLRLHRPAGRAEGAAFPVSAAGVRRARRQWAAGGGKGAERTGGRGRYLPLLAGEGGRRWPPRSRAWGLVRGRVPGARRALQAVGSGSKQQPRGGGEDGGAGPSGPRGELGRRQALSPSVLVFPPPLEAGGWRAVRSAPPLALGPALGRHSLLRAPHQVLALCLHPPRRRTFK